MTQFRGFSRRSLMQAAGATALAAAWLPKSALAGNFPDKTISFLVPDSGGGSFDAYVRKFSEIMPQFFNQPVNVEPLPTPGAGGQAAAFTLQNAAPDGYNIGMLNVPGIFTSKYNKKHKAVDLDSLTWVANLGREGYGVAVATNSGIHNVADLQKISASRPVSFSSTGFGSTDYFATRVFNNALGMNFKQVTGYTGSAPTMVAVARGDVDAVVHSLATLQAMQSSGLIRIIFSFQTDSGIAGIDDADSVGQPTLAEIYQWRPVVAPPGLPAPILKILSDALISSAATPDAKAWARAAGTTLFPLDYNGVQEMIEAQKALVEKWKMVLV